MNLQFKTLVLFLKLQTYGNYLNNFLNFSKKLATFSKNQKNSIKIQ